MKIEEKQMRKIYVLLGGLLLFSLGACAPTVKLASEPIEINLNVKIEHEVRIKVDKELEELFEDEELF